MGPYRTKREIALTLLRDAIVGGELAPGTRLVLEDLARTYDLSLTPIREALPILEAEGFITQHPHRGAVVAPLDRDEVLELYATRRAVEALAARHGVPRTTAGDLAAMADLLANLDAYAGDLEGFLDLDKQFHLVLYRAAGSRRWVDTIETLWRRSARYMLASTAMSGAVPQIHADHRAILAACRERDAALAEALLDAHLAHSEQRLLHEWPDGAEPPLGEPAAE